MSFWPVENIWLVFPCAPNSSKGAFGYPSIWVFWGVTAPQCHTGPSVPWGSGGSHRLMAFVLPPPHIPLPHKQPRATREGQALLGQAWAQGWAFLLPPTSPGLSQHCSSLLRAFSSLQSWQSSRICSHESLGRLWQSLPSVGPLMLQETWSLASDSLSSFFILLSVPEGPGLSPKSSVGLIQIQKALRSSFSSFSCLQVSRACAADWSQFGVLLRREISKSTSRFWFLII